MVLLWEFVLGHADLKQVLKAIIGVTQSPSGSISLTLKRSLVESEGSVDLDDVISEYNPLLSSSLQVGRFFGEVDGSVMAALIKSGMYKK